MPQVEIGSHAVADIDQIYDFIAIENQSPQAATRFIRELHSKFNQYAHQPGMGEPREDLDEGLHRLPVLISERFPNYIGVRNQSPVAAHKFLDDFELKCHAYANQPEMGEPRPELGDELRSFTFKKNDVVVFQPYENGIEILRVIHGARDYPTLFGD